MKTTIMKTKITKIGTLALMLLAVFACEKKDVELAEAKEQKFAVVTYLEDQKGSLEKAIIVGTKAELEASLMKEEAPRLKKMSAKVNLLIPTGVVAPVGPTPDPYDPYTACWDEIEAYYDAHIAEWQALADATCQVVSRCLTCPQAGVGLFVMYAIQPNPRRCSEAVAHTIEERYHLNSFNFEEEDYDSEALIEFIAQAK